MYYFLSRLFVLLAKSADQREKEREDAYLAEATDLYDLEFRMRSLDRQKAQPASWMGR